MQGNSLNNKRITVTGGAGFLGSFVVERLTEAGAQVFVPQIEDYDLTDLPTIRRLYTEARPMASLWPPRRSRATAARPASSYP